MIYSATVVLAIYGTFITWYFGVRGIIPYIPITMLSSALAGGVIFLSEIKSLKIKGKFEISLIDLLFSVFFLTLIFLVSFNYAIGGKTVDSDGRSLAEFHAVLIFMFLFNFILGKLFVARCIQKKWGVAGFLIATLVVLANINPGSYSINMEGASAQDGGVYLALADLYAIGAIIALSSLNSNLSRTLVMTLSVVCLFFIGSRGSLYAFILSTGLYVLLFFSFRMKLVGVGAVFALVFLFLPEIVEVLESNMRMIFGEGGYSDDASFIARNYFLEIGIAHIIESPFFGVYNGVIRDTGSVGGYIHNILSFWQQFGLIPFVLVILIVIIPAIGAILFITKKPFERRDSFDSAALLLGSFCLFMVFLARSYSWIYLWLYAGYLSSYFGRYSSPLYSKKFKIVWSK